MLKNYLVFKKCLLGYKEKEGKERQNLCWNSHSYYHATKDNQKL